MDAITLDSEVACIVGILPRERQEPQLLRIALRMELELDGPGESGDLAQGVDYAAVDGQIRFLAVESRFRLIESFSIAILRTVLSPPAAGEPRAQVRRATVRIAKPAVLRSALPAVELTRTAAWAARAPEVLPGGGTAEMILAAPEVSVRRLTLPAGAGFSYGAAYGIVGVQGQVAVPFRSEQASVLLAVRRLP